MMLSHSPLVIRMVLFPALTQLDQTGSYEVFGRMPATNVHLLAEMVGPVQSELGFTIMPDRIWASNPPLDVISRQRWGACDDGTCAVARIPSGTEHIRDVSHGGLYWPAGSGYRELTSWCCHSVAIRIKRNSNTGLHGHLHP